MGNRPSRHHTVPQFYLKRWAGSTGKRLWVLDKKELRIYPSSPRDVAVEREFYTDGSGRVDLETRLAVLETRAAPILREIVKAESADGLTDEERSWLDLFLAVQMERTQGGRIRRMQTNRAFAHHLALMERRGIDMSAVRDDLVMADVKDEHVASVAEVGDYLGPYSRLGLGVRVAMGTLEFTTSDEPLLFRNKHGEDTIESFRPPLSGPTRTIHASRILRISDRNAKPNALGNLGITSPGIEIFLPLSPSVALVAMDTRVFPHGRYPYREEWSDEEVKELRALVLESSVRHVYGASNDFSFEERHLAENSSWRDPDRARVSVFYMDTELVDASRRGDFDIPTPGHHELESRD